MNFSTYFIKFRFIKNWIPNLLLLFIAILFDSFYYPFSSIFIFVLFFLIFLSLIFFKKSNHFLPIHIILFIFYACWGYLNNIWMNDQFKKQFKDIYKIEEMIIYEDFPADGDGGNGGFIKGRAFLISSDLMKDSIFHILSTKIDINQLKTIPQFSIPPIPKRFRGDEMYLVISEIDKISKHKKYYYQDQFEKNLDEFNKSKYLLEFCYWEEDPF